MGEGLAVRGPVSKLDSFTLAGKDHRVIAYHIAATHGVHTDLRGGAFAGEAVPAVPGGLRQLQAQCVGKDLGQGLGGAAGRVLLVAMMHFDHLDVEGWTEDLRRLACQPEQGVDSHRKVG